jgi:CRP-like cAMP-binding protein
VKSHLEGALVKILKGGVLIREGERAERAYLVREGAFEVVRTGGDGSERRVDLLGPGALVTDSRSGTVRAAEDSSVHVLTRDELDRVMSRDASFPVRLKQLVSLS